MTISDNNTSLHEGELCSWVGHVHYDDGHVAEVNVLTVDRRDKLDALAKVCKVAGIKSANEVGIKGVILTLDGVSGERTLYGTALRGTTAPSNVVELRPTMSRFRVTVYPSPMAGYTVVRDISAPNSVGAINGVLQTVGVDNLDKAGPYLVQKYGEQGALTTVLKHGTIPGDTSAPVGILPAPVSYKTEAESFLEGFKLLLSAERTHRVPRNRIIRMEGNVDESTV